jgi:DNA-binding MurR/RpiR family transcriptional regulator
MATEARARTLACSAESATPSSAPSTGAFSTGAVNAFLETVGSQYESLPRQLRSIARHVEANRERMVVTRITDIARACGVQPSAVTRFSQRFGFSGYRGLQALFRDAFSASTTPSVSYSGRIRGLLATRARTDTGGILRRLLLANQGAIEEFALQIDERTLTAAAGLLQDAGQIIVVGTGRSLAVATFLTYLLQHTTKRVQQVNGAGANLVGHSRSIGVKDVLVAISFSPYSRDTRGCVERGSAQGAKILAITDSRMSPAGRAAEVVLLVKEASAFSFRSLTNTMCLCQALFIALATRLELDIDLAHRQAALEEADPGAAS